jgi:hypothetical protein
LTSLTETFTRSYMRLEGALDLVATHIGHGDGRVVNTLIPARAHALYTRRWSQQPKMVRYCTSHFLRVATGVNVQGIRVRGCRFRGR